jgi:FlaA1/EpsC-like NDP-sugar epimerase
MFNRNLPRGIVFLIDMGICLFSLAAAYALRFNFSVPEVEIRTFGWVFPLVLLTRALSFVIFRTYAGIIRYTSTQDTKRIFLTIISGSLFFAALNPVVFLIEGIYAVPYSIIIIDFLVTLFLMITLRIAVKLTYLEYRKPTGGTSKVVIFGAGEAGVITKRTLDRDVGMRYKVVAFFDDDSRKAGKKLEGIPIYLTKKHIEKQFDSGKIQSIIISIQGLSPRRKQEVIEISLKYNIKVLTIPPVSNWINGQLSFGQMQNIRIEDLLERDPIALDYDTIQEKLFGKRVMITGAAGSIGSEMVRQVMKFKPDKLIMLDSAESPLYDIEMEIGDSKQKSVAETVIADIRNQERMTNVFKTFKPQLIFHAAAYKHVPMMENNPSEAILTNIYGTKIVADLAVEYNVENFVMVSTDKAVNPTNIMGATKRIAEIYTQSLSQKGKTKFITTRFGNVLGSNGSVIPRFRKQIQNRQPITITHPDITRYFMTIPEACQLVLEAGAIGKGGEIFIFDMGKSVKIVDLAKKMVQLSGLVLDKDIELVYTGLRPGEKLYEELLANEENTIPTHHNKIMIAKVKEYNFDEISKDINHLISLFDKQDNNEIVKKIKQIVPEYISNNSVFEELDS